MAVQPAVDGEVATRYPVMSLPLPVRMSSHDTTLLPAACVTVMFFGAHGVTGALPMFSNLFGVCSVRPEEKRVTASQVACFFTHAQAAVAPVARLVGADASPCRYCATAPLTCGAAIEVPDSTM